MPGKRKQSAGKTILLMLSILIFLAGLVLALYPKLNAIWIDHMLNRDAEVFLSFVHTDDYIPSEDSFQDIMSGLTIMTDKYFSVGDAVEYNGREGIVISFTVRTTKIELLADRSVVSVANRNISQIRKLTHLVDIDLPLPYELERKESYAVLGSICDDIREISGVESCELKGTQDFADSAIIYKIRFFCEPHDRPDIRREVLRTIQDGLDKADIHIPYRQLDIHEK